MQAPGGHKCMRDECTAMNERDSVECVPQLHTVYCDSMATRYVFKTQHAFQKFPHTVQWHYTHNTAQTSHRTGPNQAHRKQQPPQSTSGHGRSSMHVWYNLRAYSMCAQVGVCVGRSHCPYRTWSPSEELGMKMITRGPCRSTMPLRPEPPAVAQGMHSICPCRNRPELTPTHHQASCSMNMYCSTYVCACRRANENLENHKHICHMRLVSLPVKRRDKRDHRKLTMHTFDAAACIMPRAP